MNVLRYSLLQLRGVTSLNSIATPNGSASSHHRLLSSWVLSRAAPEPLISRCAAPLLSQTEHTGVFQQLPWHYQQVRTKKRGTEYQPKNIKRIRTHGWVKRLSTKEGIEVILRRMLKGRKSLSH